MIAGKTRTEVNALVERTNKINPKPEDIKEMQRVLDEAPGLVLHFGNLKQQVFKSLLESATGNSALTGEAVARYVENMKDELGYRTSTFVEKLLIDEIVMRWLRLTVMDNDHKNATYREHSFSEGMYYDKRLHQAQKRYLKAIETLAKVRKMLAQTQAKGVEMFKNLVDKT